MDTPNTGSTNDYSKIQDPARTLLKIVHGDVSNVKIPHKAIITSKKIKNEVLRKFVEVFRESKTVDEKYLTDIILVLDEAVEKELVTQDVLNEIRKDPKKLDNLLHN